MGVIPIALGIAGAASSGGKDGGGSSNSAADAQSAIAAELFKQTNPLRKELIDRSTQFANGNLDVTSSPLYAPVKNSIETSFDNAKQNIMGSAPAGGALLEALTNLEGQKAGALATGTGQIAGQELQNALGLSTGSLSQSIAGYGSAAASQAQQAQAQAAQNAAKTSQLGQVGFALAMK